MPVASGGSDAYDPRMEARVARLEEDVREVKAVLSRLEPIIVRMDAVITSTLPQLATKAEVAQLRGEMHTGLSDLRGELHTGLSDLRGELRAGLAEKPSKTYLWGILGVLITAYAAGLAALAIVR